ncbi:MAG: hypothetical protein DRQ49_14480 [Gammaproteobacteria bacterium]|nr:MAG: hypothetical protein DRQ49_14480 [Gammaproteobacteria bacterium]RKZ76422.1 MAG: hypothetical protein DRQ57_03985 [Gammaproteobacteria bacterium]
MIPRLITIVLSLLLITNGLAEHKQPGFDINMIIIKVPIVNQSMDDAIKELKQRASMLNISQIGYSPLTQEYEALGLSNIRRTECFQFCDAKVAMALIEYNMDYAAFLPCRIALVEDKQGKGWFVMSDPALLTSQLPADLRSLVDRVCGNLMKVIGGSSVLTATALSHLSSLKIAVKTPIAEDVSIDDAVDSLKRRANDLNMKLVGHKILINEYSKLELTHIKRIEYFQFCDGRVAQKMLEHYIGFAAYMPCHIILVENQQGQGWFVMMNLDLLIILGHLPPDLKQEAIKIRDILMEMMKAGANGEF